MQEIPSGITEIEYANWLNALKGFNPKYYPNDIKDYFFSQIDLYEDKSLYDDSFKEAVFRLIQEIWFTNHSLYHEKETTFNTVKVKLDSLIYTKVIIGHHQILEDLFHRRPDTIKKIAPQKLKAYTNLIRSLFNIYEVKKCLSAVEENPVYAKLILPELEEIEQNTSSINRTPLVNKRLITFKSVDIIEKLHEELKGYFEGNEQELRKALKGEQVTTKLLFQSNQNKFVELFKRLKYNGYLLSTSKEIENWLCTTFSYTFQKGEIKEVRNFHHSSVHDILTKSKGEPKKTERICILDWLPYKSHEQLK
jgi:hypothetical protein